MADGRTEDIERCGRILYSFHCELNPDVEEFLHNRAVEFERVSKARTYLVCDEGALISRRELAILGYFSLAMKTLHIPEEVSNRKRKELDGYGSKNHGLPVNEIPCYLIGQLAKNTDICSDAQQVNGSMLVDYACSVILSAIHSVGGRYAMIECCSHEKLINFYSNNGFKKIAEVPDREIPMTQMIRKLAKD